MTGHGAKLGHKKEAALVALLSHRSIEDAARAVDIAPKTLMRWLKEPEFNAAYREARRLAFSQSVARLQQACGAAVSTLLKVMVDPNTPASTRVRAADSVLDHSAKAIEIEDIEARVAELEKATESSKSRHR
jgi:hypothetical protein